MPPDVPRLFFGAGDVARTCADPAARPPGRHAAPHVFLCLALYMIANFVVEILQHATPHDFAHDWASPGLRIPAMARTSFSHLVVSTRNCLRPFAVSR